ncbi:MAG: SET domain-containing protein [Reyranella sp.]|nr:SET domain-containing protein [Reyranella sp.]
MKRKTSKAFVYLGASGVHGIGCFADQGIKKGEIVRVWDGEDSRWVSTRQVDASRHAVLYKKFGIRSTGGYWVPLDFLRISTGWYMNHAADPNLGSDDGDVTYHALRHIAAGEELTIDYRRMDEVHDNLSRDEHVPAVTDPKRKKQPRRLARR